MIYIYIYIHTYTCICRQITGCNLLQKILDRINTFNDNVNTSNSKKKLKYIDKKIEKHVEQARGLQVDEELYKEKRRDI